MIAVPIGLWTVGEASTPPLMLTAVCLQAAAVATILARAWGWPQTFLILVTLAFLGWLLEAVGTATGYPFGTYHYTEKLQPQIAYVPLLIPLAWFMMLPVSWAIAYLVQAQIRGVAVRIKQMVFKEAWFFILLAAVAMTSWDLFLDPQMVLWQFWVWENVPSFSYFGIPWLNYFGWFAGSAAITAVVVYLIRPDWNRLPVRPLLLVYTITWFLETFGLLLFWGLVGPALVGGAAVGTLLLLAWRPLLLEPHTALLESHD